MERQNGGRWQRPGSPAPSTTTPPWRERNRQTQFLQSRMARVRLLDAFRGLETHEHHHEHVADDDHAELDQKLCEDYLKALETEVEFTMTFMDRMGCPLCKRCDLQNIDTQSLCPSCGFQGQRERVEKLQEELERHRVNCSEDPAVFTYPEITSDVPHLTLLCNVCDYMDVFPL